MITNKVRYVWYGNPSYSLLAPFNSLGIAKMIINYRSTCLSINKKTIGFTKLSNTVEYTQYRPNWSIFSL